ncbi:MAG: hypothetical protein H0X37_04365 [Herpetosiphonaceae bacterium]|nr:hypothetical protein [Herpetosiphonaceae bacterium]
MRQPDPPFLELSFYFADRTGREAFTQLVTTLVGFGATFTGEGKAHKGVGLRDQPFGSLSDELREPLPLENSEALTRWTSDPNTRLLQVSMGGATGAIADVAEIVTYESISDEAASVDHHPVAIWTEGELFSGTFPKTHAGQARKVGQQTYERFRLLVEALAPAYAAITTEYGLECPEDLRRDARSYAFQDFFVSRSYLGANKVAKIQNLFAEAYAEPVGDGIYISCHRFFNPEGKDSEAKYGSGQSGEVARLIASTVRR